MINNADNCDRYYYPLTTQQKGMWNIEQVYPGTSIGIISASVTFRRTIDFSLLKKAINLCLQANDSFQLRITLSNNQPQQYFEDYRYKNIDTYYFENDEKLCQWRQSLTTAPIRLIDSPMYYFAMFNVDNRTHGYYFKLHHLIADAWTVVIITNQIAQYYNKLENNIPITMEKQPSYLEFIHRENDYLSSKIFQKNKEFWDNKFSSFPEFNMIRPYIAGKSIKANRKTFVISKELSQKINAFIKEHKISPFTLFIAALAIYINKLTSKKDIVLGSPILNRTNAREKATAGMFINIIPLRFQIDISIDFTAFVQDIARQIMQHLKNQKYPYDLLLLDFKKKHRCDKIYDVMFSYQNSRLDEDTLSLNEKNSWHFNGYQTESLCIHLNDRDNTGEFIADFDYLIDAFNEDEIIKIYEYITNIIEDAITNPDSKVSSLKMLSKDEMELMLSGLNGQKHEYDANRVFHQVFEEEVQKNPGATAVICNGNSITYGELNSRANQLARLLRLKGIKPETVVGIMASRSIEVVVGIFAILKAGGAYLPIDPSYPKDRIQYILKDSKLGILLTDRVVDPKGLDCELIYIDNCDVYKGDDGNLPNLNAPSNLMYIIYTSGSTGNPKGVMIEHKSFMNIAYAWKKEYRLEQFDVKLLQLASFSFDVFSGDLARTFINQGTMVIASEEEKYSFPKLCKLINKYDISVFESTPSLIIPFMEYIYKGRYNIDSLKLLILGSDICISQDFRKLVDRFGKQMRIINSYGVTEATIDSSYYEAELHEIPIHGNVPIGKPLPNVKFYILGDDFEVKPIGVVGELYISGQSIARGYFGKQELTRERFLDSPFVKGEVIYKTGDLAKWLPDGNVAFIGRADTQVKIKGFRIELGEIESKILNVPGIKEAVVLAEKNILYAFFTSENEIDIKQIKEFLQNVLPQYMIPSYFTRLDYFPLSPNGKVDKKAIMEHYDGTLNITTYVEPAGHVERALCSMWEEVLERDKIGVCDNFFDIGGDSLAAISIVSMAYYYGLDLSIQDFYRHQTIRELATVIDERRNLEELALTVEKNEPVKYSNNDFSIVMFKHGINNISVTADYFNPENVLITGATGFLGIHLLYEMLNSTGSNFYCLVRDNGDKLFELLKFYFGADLSNLLNKRIFLVHGDVSLHHFGLLDSEYSNLMEKVDTVIHAAALVKHYGNDRDFEKVNVLGTEKVIKFCLEGHKRLIYISTLSVSGDTLRQEKELSFSENDFYIGQNYTDNVYIKSKFEAENLVLKAINEGLNAIIMRVGNLTGRYKDGVFQKNIQDNMFYNIVKAIILIKAVPDNLLDVDIELTPVDLCSRAILKIAKTKESNKRIFHLFNNNTVKIAELIKFISAMGYDVYSIESSSFLKYIKDFNNKGGNVSSSLFLANDYNFEKIADKNYKVNVTSDFTRIYLQKLDFTWPKIDEEYFSKFIGYVETVDFLK